MDKPVQKAALSKEELTPKLQPRKKIYNIIMTSLGVFVCMSFTFAGLMVLQFDFRADSWISWTLFGIMCASATVAGIGILVENKRLASAGSDKLFELKRKEESK